VPNEAVLGVTLPLELLAAADTPRVVELKGIAGPHGSSR
jgi:hypothetical protein